MTKPGLKFEMSALLVLISFFAVGSAALFHGCDHNYVLQRGYAYVQSPYYPKNYPARSSCRYKFTAPLDYHIRVNCTTNLQTGSKGCSTEFFYIARDGDVQLRGAEQFCGRGTIIRQSLFRTVTLAYASYGGTGNFQCSLYASPQPCDCGWSVNTKIVNGRQASVNEYPSAVALRTRTSGVYCGGAIVSHRYIITAAHCARAQSNAANILAIVGLIVGEHDLGSSTETRYTQTLGIQKIIEHPRYTSNPVSNDIALLLTAKNIEWSRGVGPICLPPSDSSKFAYTYADVIGWGTTKFAGPTSRVLLKVTLQIADNSACVQSYKGQAPIYQSNICTYDNTGKGRDSCQFDSGGPVILRHARQFLIGVISFGKVCGSGGYAMGVNTRVSSFLNWIRSHAGARCNVPL